MQSYGKRREIKLNVLKSLIVEVDKKYNGTDDKWLRQYIDESMKNFEGATDEQVDEALKCFRELRDKI